MKVEINKEFLMINISDLVSEMDEDARKIFYQEIVFEEKLLEACMDFLVSNYAFEDSYHSTTYSTIVSRLGDRLKAKCIPLMEKASQELIKNLQSDLKYMANEYEKYRNYAFKLEREWPRIQYEDGEPIAVTKLPNCPRLEDKP